jgi:hypothetical protein
MWAGSMARPTAAKRRLRSSNQKRIFSASMEEDMSVSETTGNLPGTRAYGYDRLREYDREGVQQRISWRALIAGLVIVVAIQLLLATLGAGIGLGMIHQQSSNTPDAANFTMGAGLWWLVSNLVALLVGGYLTARLAGVGSRYDGMLHGLVYGP